MTLVSPTQSNPGDTIEAADINDPVNQIAAVVNGNIDSTNISSVSGAKLQAGTVPASSLDTNANVETRMSEALGNFVASGCVWSTISGLNATMASGVIYISGKRVVVASVSSRTFTASRDTYVSVDVNGTVSYSEVTNGASAPSLPANSLWSAKLVSGASSITSITDMRTLSPGVATMNGGNYSTSEIDTGYTWIDGKKIYKKTINFGSLPNNTSKNVAHGIVGIDNVVRIYGFAKLANNSVRVPLPFTSVTALTAGMALTEEGTTSVVITTGSDRTTWSAYVTLEYTKA